MSAHTPGPWIIHDEDRIYRSIRNADNTLRIASVCVTPGQPNVHANAQLIAAAPDLLEALREASRWGNDFPDDVSILVQQALAKAGAL